MKVFEAFLPYRDRFGMNQLTSTNGIGDVTQNGALFTMEYLICLLEAEKSHDDSIVVDEEIERLWGVFKSLEREYGLSRRTPESDECDSMDNNGAILAWSAYAGGRGFAKRLIRHGETVECLGFAMWTDAELNEKYFTLARVVTATQVVWRPWLWRSWIRSGFMPKFFWNNVVPKAFITAGWFGRSPGFLGLADIAAGKWTTPLRWLGVLIGQFWGCFADVGNTDARKLPYVNWFMLTKTTGWGQRWFWCLAYKLWVAILLRQYPDGMRDVYRIYYGDPNHPIRSLSKRYFGEE